MGPGKNSTYYLKSLHFHGKNTDLCIYSPGTRYGHPMRNSLLLFSCFTSPFAKPGK